MGTASKIAVRSLEACRQLLYFTGSGIRGDVNKLADLDRLYQAVKAK
jgi:hypothetical protein